MAGRDPIRRKQWIQERKAKARAYVKAVRASTPCSKCGAFPVDFHSDEHLGNPSRRVSNMASIGRAVTAIAREIARCEALCRRCHMTEDGRLHKFTTFQRAKKPPRTCVRCACSTNVVRHGMCGKCYQREQYQSDPTRFAAARREHRHRAQGQASA